MSARLIPELEAARKINIVISIGYPMLGFIKRMCSKYGLTWIALIFLKSLYCAFVYSKLEYAAIVWQPHYRVHSIRLESVKKKSSFSYWGNLDGQIDPCSQRTMIVFSWLT